MNIRFKIDDGKTVWRRCRRRRRVLAPLAVAAMRARDEGRPLTPAVWSAAAGLLILLAHGSAVGLFLLPSVLLLAGLALIALFDARYFVIPDGPLLFLAGLGLALAGAQDELASRLAAGAAGYFALRFAAEAYAALRATAGVGEGDAKLFAVAGLWLGFAGLPSCLIYGVVSALLSAVVALRQGALAHVRDPLPFGPHLALGLWLVWVLGPLEFG